MSKADRKKARKPAKVRARVELRKRELVKRFNPHFVATPKSTQTRSAIKTVCYRTISGLETGLLAWFVVPVYGPGVFAMLDTIGNTIVYYLFERAWAHVDLYTTRKKRS